MLPSFSDIEYTTFIAGLCEVLSPSSPIQEVESSKEAILVLERALECVKELYWHHPPENGDRFCLTLVAVTKQLEHQWVGHKQKCWDYDHEDKNKDCSNGIWDMFSFEIGQLSSQMHNLYSTAINP